jgi:hypothetical protein
MSKWLLGLLLGAVLGAIDGWSAILSAPEVAPQLMGIIIGSTVKSMIVGVIAGVFARKINNLPLGLLVGGLAGLALAYAVAAMGDENGKHYYFEIMLPGTLVGLMLGWATQKFGRRTAPQANVQISR